MNLFWSTGSILSAASPFWSLLSSEKPTLEEMRQIVCSKQLRPALAEHWNQDEVRYDSLSSLATLGTSQSVLIRGVASFQGWN